MLGVKVIVILVFFGTQVHSSISADSDATVCTEQKTYIDNLKLDQEPARSKFANEFVFRNTSKPMILLTWAGLNKKVLIVTMLDVGKPSELYRSIDDGRSFERITQKLSDKPLFVMQSNGLQRNLANTSRIIVISEDQVSHASLLHVSFDDGETWREVKLSFRLTGSIMFHHTDPNYMLVLEGNTVYGSKDGGITWSLLHKHVYKVSWAEAEDKNPKAIYIAYDKSLANPFQRILSLMKNKQQKNQRSLMKSNDFGNNWQLVINPIVSYKNLKQFIYISRTDPSSPSVRHLRVSTDFGASFHMVHLPAINAKKFYSVLDVSDGLVFIHVDSGNLNGYGTLYTSDSTGRFFSKSLERHLYPPFGMGADLYRVESMRGTYLATVMHDDESMHSVITHNRGAEWVPLPKPNGAECSVKDKPCHLQIASAYSIHRGVNAMPPISISSAVGVIIAHGHAAAALQAGNSDVFVSSNGGFTWSKALEGPHLVQLANQGGLIVAIEKKPVSNVVKFSTDEGQCWHEYQFTNDNYTITGLLTEPGNRARSLAIWGFNSITKHWRLFVLDFSQVLKRECNSSDYETWLSHGQLNYGQHDRACVMGSKVTYKRLKAKSICANDYNWNSESKLQPCECTKNDFECEYGYSRAVNSLDCVRDGNVPEVDYCDDHQLKKIISDGYRKLPGNQCVGGFKPNATQQIVLKGQKCQQPTLDPEVEKGKKFINDLKERDQKAKQSAEDSKLKNTVAIIVPLFITFIVLLCIVLSVIVLARFREQRRRQLAFHFSAVSSAGRNADLSQYRPNDEIINPNLPAAPTYSATAGAAAAAAGSRRNGAARKAGAGGDKVSLIENEELDHDDDAPII